MTIWILAVLVLASASLMSWRQGAIRAAFSLVGIVLGAVLAHPLGHLLQPLFKSTAVKHPLLAWVIPPVIAFVVVLALFKIAAAIVHKKVEVYYKYKAGDLRLALWQRLNTHLGICVGLANGAAYFILICYAIYPFSYWSVQLDAASGDSKGHRLLSRLGKDLDSTGMVRVARALDRMPASFYDAADLVGMVYHTPLIEARLYRYPALLSLSETPEFQALLNDRNFTESWQRQAPVSDLVKNQNLKVVLDNPAIVKTLWETIAPNLEDLKAFLTNGISAKYASQPLLGRWVFDVNGAMAILRQTRPSIPSSEMGRIKQYIASNFANTSLVVMPDHELLVKGYPEVNVQANPPTTEMKIYKGSWKEEDDHYAITYNGQNATGEIHGERLSIIGPALGMAFVPEY